MTPLSHALEHTSNLRSAIYSDNTTLWVLVGGDAMIKLNQGASTAHQHAKAAGLSCSVPKSELLPSDLGPHRYTVQLNPFRYSLLAPLSPMYHNSASLDLSYTQPAAAKTQITGLIKCITVCKHGLVEPECIHLLHSFASRFCYHLLYATPTLTQQKYLDALLRCACCAALHLPTTRPYRTALSPRSAQHCDRAT